MDFERDAIRDEATRYLQDLIRIDTTNPPGNETKAAEYLAAVFKREGIEPTILESAPGRGNLVARLKGDGRAAPLLLMVHIDVVPAEADQWTHPPFGGDIADGYLWGRGTLDTKELAAMELMAMLLLKRDTARKPLARDIIFMANADEEAGGRLGAGWMVKEHPDLIRAEYAINAGGGFGLDILGQRFFTCQVAEKGTARFAMRTRGRPGHGSQPHRDNSVLKLADAIQRI
ncbi:MAG: M20/M25/M40 family metallo-hydrolase, partial [Chloroflexota bacterium]|nr:M20/M25/M40 family metallo-hydrolase [Chloroflexota bacterium]